MRHMARVFDCKFASEEFRLCFVMMDDRLSSDNLEVEMTIEDVGDGRGDSVAEEWNKRSLVNYVESTRLNMN